MANSRRMDITTTTKEEEQSNNAKKDDEMVPSNNDDENGTSSSAWWPPVLILSLGWALGFSVLTACAASLNLAGVFIMDDASTTHLIATLPLALTGITSGMYNLILSMEIQHLGRYHAYILGSILGTIGCLCCMVACQIHSMVLLCFGAIGIGMGMAHAQNFRFGVVDCISNNNNSLQEEEEEQQRRIPLAISWVLAGGVVGAIIGPEYSKHTKNLLSDAPYAGIFLVSGSCFFLLFLLLVVTKNYLKGLQKQPPSDEIIATDSAMDVEIHNENHNNNNNPPEHKKSLCQLFFCSRARTWSCTFVASASYGLMVYFMAAVPLAMTDQEGFSFSESSLVVQIHMVTMFAPSFVTGYLYRWIGGPVVLIVSGACLFLIGSALVNDRSMIGFTLSQAFTGLAWNLCFLSATTGLKSSLIMSAEEEKHQECNNDKDMCIPVEEDDHASIIINKNTNDNATRVESMNDVFVFTTSGICMILAAPSLASLGWTNMQFMGYALSVLMLLSVTVSEMLDKNRTTTRQADNEPSR